MALNFAGYPTANCAVSFSTTGLTTFPYGTSAAVLWVITNVPSGANGRSIVFMGHGVNLDDSDVVNLWGTPQNAPSTWNSTGTTDCVGTTGISTGRWCLIAISKATGNVAPRVHTFDWSTGVWTHAAASATTVDSAATGQTIYQISGTMDGTSFGGVNCDIAATCEWHQRVLSDSEVERLAAGNWTAYSPDILVEWRSGRTVLGAGPYDHGRQRMPTNTFGSAVTRTARADPPGFRFTPLGRRR